MQKNQYWQGRGNRKKRIIKTLNNNKIKQIFIKIYNNIKLKL